MEEKKEGKNVEEGPKKEGIKAGSDGNGREGRNVGKDRKKEKRQEVMGRAGKDRKAGRWDARD